MQGSAADKDGKGDIWGLACAEYINHYAAHINVNPSKGETHVRFQKHHGYIKGYLSALNICRENGLRDIKRGHSWETVYLYVDKYCRDNPLDHMHNALMAFVYEMEHK